MAKHHGGDYEIGHGRPPRHSQFQPGKSGNPAGRPPGRKNLATIARNALHEEIVVTENGKSRKVTKAQAAIMQMVNGAVKGNLRAAKETIQLVRYVDQCDEVGVAPDESENDAAVLASLKRRFRRIADVNVEGEAAK